MVTVIRSKLAVAQDPQTEHVLNRDCLNVSRVNEILRVHGQTLVADAGSLSAFDERARREQERFFGLTEESFAQAALGAKVGGLGWRTATGTARTANL